MAGHEHGGFEQRDETLFFEGVDLTDTRTREDRIHDARAQGVDVTYPNDGFAGLGGMDEAKGYLWGSLVSPLRSPDTAAAFGMGAGARLLLWGPPGCGKTLFARAAAAEADAALIIVQLSDVLGSYVGEDEKNLHLYFETAREFEPCVLFFDEADSLAPRRNSPGMWEIERRMTNAFLQELDGAKSLNDGVAVVLATNQPWLLDPAMRRAGRVDGMMYVGLPDERARKAVWDIALHRVPVSADVDTASLAGLSRGLTGAELAEVVRRATRAAFVQSVDCDAVVELHQLDLLHALARTHARSADWFTAADASFCEGHHQTSRDWLSAGAFNTPEHKRLVLEALNASAADEVAGW